jgi:hypothetical protein
MCKKILVDDYVLTKRERERERERTEFLFCLCVGV